MNNKYLITIIMPIYNSETYLSKTIDSIIKQSIGFNNIELILVDDKSTDDSRNIIQDYALRYNNIVPIYLDKNSGYPGVGRNIGIKKSKAEYIMFIDSDDEYEFDMCEILYTTITENECDCVECNYNKIDYLTEESPQKNNNSYEKLFLKPNDALYIFRSFTWNKIFKKSIIEENNIKFVTDRVGEDTFFCIEYIINSNSIIYLDKYFGYKYFDRNESFSTTNLKWNLNVIKHYYESLDILNKNQIKINLTRFFNSSINYTIFCTIKMEENNFKSIFKVLNELYLFEKKIKFDKNQGVFLFRFINKFINTNHISTATLIVLLLNRIRSIKIAVKIYRKLIKKV